MGCVNSNAVGRLDGLDNCHALVPKDRSLTSCKPRRTSCRESFEHQCMQMALASICKDKGEKSYQSYTDTPVSAPEGVCTLPDREMHDSHLKALDIFLSLVEYEPSRFQHAISKSRHMSDHAYLERRKSEKSRPSSTSAISHSMSLAPTKEQVSASPCISSLDTTPGSSKGCSGCSTYDSESLTLHTPLRLDLEDLCERLAQKRKDDQHGSNNVEAAKDGLVTSSKHSL